MRICVSVTTGTTAQVIETMGRLGSVCDLFEIRADLVGDLDLASIVRARTHPLVFTCLTRVEGGTWPDEDPRRHQLLLSAIHSGIDYVDVNLRSGLVDVMGEKAGQGLIVSYHDLDGVPEDLDAIYRSMVERRADIAKIAVRPTTVADVGRFQAFARRVAGAGGPPLIPIAMGPLGVSTRILGGRFGAPFTFASSASGAESAPGQVPAAQMRQRYRAHEIGRGTRVWGVVGHDVGDHPILAVHNAAFRARGLDAVCVPVETDSLASLLEGLPGLQLAGFAVERPYRHDIVAHLDDMDDEGKRCGCAGTVVIRDGRMAGFETDGQAVANAFPQDFDLSGRSAVILGTGAVARATALCLSRCGAQATLVARRPSRGADQARSVGLTVVSADELDRLPWEVLVNAAPAASPSVSPVSEACLSRGGLVVDMLPGPQPTPLLAEAQARGCTTVDGNAVLLARCALQLRRWTDLEPPVEEMRRALDKSAEESS